MKGACCYRKSNSARLSNVKDGKVTLEYRLPYFMTTNHPKTISGPIITSSTEQRFDKEEQHLLFRFELPYQDGKFVAGEGIATIGAGRYNCDGTYSFYSEKAAPAGAQSSDPARWAARPVKVKVDPTKANWEEQVHTVWATNVNREVTYLPYIEGMGNKPLEWEAASQGFDITKMPKIDTAINCVGSRVSDTKWMGAGETVSYQPLKLNDKSQIGTLQGISLAHLQAFGPTGGKDDPKYDPNTVERCQPGVGDCIWKKLPDSLCPETDEEKKMWGCHVGDPMNEDKVATKCSMDKPTTALDPDMGATSEGQCCDPLAKNTNGLPACNAYRLLSDFVAAAAEITDAPSDKLQGNCEKP